MKKTYHSRSSRTHDSVAQKKTSRDQLVKESSKVSEMLETMKPIEKTPRGRRDYNRTTDITHGNSIDSGSIDTHQPFNESITDHDPNRLNQSKQGQIPMTMYADFIESGTTGDIDVFLTRVSQMPAAS